jgi:hypothetical protein
VVRNEKLSRHELTDDQLDAEGILEWAQAFMDGSFVPAKERVME